MLSEFKDRILIFKESIKASIFNNPLLKNNSLGNAIIKDLGLKNVKRIFIGKPNTLIIITKKNILRMPLDRLSAIRCRVNKIMLKKTQKTNIANLTPRILQEGEFQGKKYYCEEKLPGVAIGLPIKKMDELVVKAADFITKFHQETAKDITITESNFKRLFGRDFERLNLYLNDEYREKLKTIKQNIKKQLIDKKFKTVWMHGDYKVENILVNTKTWHIEGIIDWDLSGLEGLPLLDVFYLLIDKKGIMKRQQLLHVFCNGPISSKFSMLEQKIIDKYLGRLMISDQFIRPMLIMFWINTITRRYRQQLIDEHLQKDKWNYKHIYSVIDVILQNNF
ncbi:MAG: aminoglycoside phosphotransferase family protein [Candidatus Omnitrophica bacterium]|nr:aminoglycoside phosphotransferase family protein [Candidatus Omnitrophota bacterium]